jgi:hypothetical protein
MATISSQHLALLQTHESASRVEVWLGPARGDLDEAAITDGWLPTTGDGWQDMSGSVLLTEGIDLAHDGRGYAITFTVADESRLVWADDLAVAVVSRHWDGAAWTDRTLDAWGYLSGEGRQQLGQNLDQTGQRTATYTGYWDRTTIPAHRFGRRNLAQGATVAGASDALASVTAEAGVEYISQDDNAASKAIDGNADTPYIADVIADPTQPTIGGDTKPRLLRAYAGRTTRSIGAGNEPVWVEVSYTHQVATWGAFTSSGAVPDLFGYGSNTRSDGQVVSTINTGGGFYQVRALQQAGSDAMNGVQWNLDFGLSGRAWKLRLEFKAASPGSIGRRMFATLKDLDPGAGAGAQAFLSLTDQWQTHDLDLDSANYGGVVLRFQNYRGDVSDQDVYFAFRFSLWVGYSDLQHARENTSERLFISYDDGNGVTRTQRIAFDLANGADDWRIPPLGSVIVADDAATFRAKFDPGDRQVFQMRNLQPEWFFGPGVGKVALRYGTNPNRNQYAPSGTTLVDSIDFTTNGLSWTPTQGVSRQSPIGTGAFAVEDYPHVGLLPGAYGAAYLWLDLKAYSAPVLTLPMDSTQLTMQVDDGDRLTPGQEASIGSERVLVGDRTDGDFAIVRHQGGTTAAAHSAGDTVTPRVAGAAQTGPQWDAVEIRRKPGTPAILAGAVISSNLATPGDPSSGGSKWERHPDWSLVARFDNSAGAEVITVRPQEGVRQARHVCVVIDRMARRGGVPQRAKLNEVVVREWLPGGNAGGGWSGHGASNVAEVAAHLLTRHGGVPASKVALTASPAPMGDLPVAGAPLSRALANLEDDGALRVWCDPYNAVTVAPDPASPQYDAREPYATLDASVLLGELSGSWGVRAPVAQVRGTFRETATLRTHMISYPDIPGLLGEVVEIRGTVRSWQDGRDRCEREYRARNARRTPQQATIGPAPWLRPWLRVVYDSAELDAGGQWQGVNCCIRAFAIRYEAGPGGGAVCTCSLTLQETVL